MNAFYQALSPALISKGEHFLSISKVDRRSRVALHQQGGRFHSRVRFLYERLLHQVLGESIGQEDGLGDAGIWLLWIEVGSQIWLVLSCIHLNTS